MNTDSLKLDFEKNTQNGQNLSGTKEMVNRLRVVGFVDGEFTTLLDARFYMGRSRSASVVTCSVWAHEATPGAPGARRVVGGSGRASGYGYHKESAACEAALRSMGVEGVPHFGGAGEGPMDRVLLALARSFDGWADVPMTVL